jgi:uncharacterized protein (TIGR02145 family)
MKTKILLHILALLLNLSAKGQNTIDLAFTAENNGNLVQSDSIKVMNRTQGGDTVLYWPDTLLSIYCVGTPENSDFTRAFRVYQNYPNPVKDKTTVTLHVPMNDKVTIHVTDIMGRVILRSERTLDKGNHSFELTIGNGNLFFFTAIWQEQSSTIKILQSGLFPNETTTLEYTAREDCLPQLRSSYNIQGFYFTPGDELLFISYANGLQSGIIDSPEESKTYIFQFATNIPCPGIPTVEYGGQVYNTIQIFSQCWLKENLNVGEMIEGTIEQSNNGILEKYCYENNTFYCTTYGGLYQWNEMMQYTTQPGVQGICPPGWHIPTDEEWKVLEGAVDNQYGIGNNIWETGGYRGYNAGTNLKTTSGWYGNGNGTDIFLFSGLPGGVRNFSGDFGLVGDRAYWWTSKEAVFAYAMCRVLNYYYSEVLRDGNFVQDGYSVRCTRDLKTVY